MLARRLLAVLAATSAMLMLCGCPAPDRNFTVSIERAFQTEEEEVLIAIAENVCPLREDVLAVARAEDRGALEAEAGEGCLWWYTIGKLPYAITAEAIGFWAAEVERLQERAWSPLRPRFPQADFTYFATIEFQAEFEEGEKQFAGVYLVTMYMDYFEGFGPLSAWGFCKQRRVVLTAEGEVLAVFGDGMTLEIVA